MSYKHFGAMLDMSRNGVMKISSIKKFIDYLEKMGYNMLELYTEDTYKLDGEPLFGYLRGGYTKEELREVDEYARAHGIELVPCIQTLAHLGTLKNIPQYQHLFDIDDILLVDCDEVYILIDKIFKQLSECFTSRLVNIGMDEAHMVGLGKYLELYGMKDRFEILYGHLEKVLAIAGKYGFKCHMWSDMFFRLANGGLYYPEHNERIELREDITDKLPPEIELTFWGYYHDDFDKYSQMMDAHKRMGREIWFAGGAWCWDGFGPQNFFSLGTMLPAMRSCIENNIENVFITLWGDEGVECSMYSTLPALYAIRKFADGIEDMEQIKRGFKETLGFDFDAFMTLDLPSITKKNGVLNANYNSVLPNLAVTSILTYCDVFLGKYDYGLSKLDYLDFGDFAKQIRRAKSGAGEFEYVFDYMEKLCDFLSVKAYLGIEVRDAYGKNDKKALKNIAKKLDLAIKKLDVFTESYKYRWFEENKPFGFEVLDIRLGGVKARLISCKQRLLAYLKGKIDSIPELEEPILSLGDRDDLWNHVYTDSVTTNVF